MRNAPHLAPDRRDGEQQSSGEVVTGIAAKATECGMKSGNVTVTRFFCSQRTTLGNRMRRIRCMAVVPN
jgi:hypothetical protein